MIYASVQGKKLHELLSTMNVVQGSNIQELCWSLEWKRKPWKYLRAVLHNFYTTVQVGDDFHIHSRPEAVVQDSNIQELCWIDHVARMEKEWIFLSGSIELRQHCQRLVWPIERFKKYPKTSKIIKQMMMIKKKFFFFLNKIWATYTIS